MLSNAFYPVVLPATGQTRQEVESTLLGRNGLGHHVQVDSTINSMNALRATLEINLHAQDFVQADR